MVHQLTRGLPIRFQSLQVYKKETSTPNDAFYIMYIRVKSLQFGA